MLTFCQVITSRTVKPDCAFALNDLYLFTYTPTLNVELKKAFVCVEQLKQQRFNRRFKIMFDAIFTLRIQVNKNQG